MTSKMIARQEFLRRHARITCHKSFRFHRRPPLPSARIKAKAQTSIFKHKCQNCRMRIVKTQPLQKLRIQASALCTGKPNARRPRSPSPLKAANNPHHHTTIDMMTAMNSMIMSVIDREFGRVRLEWLGRDRGAPTDPQLLRSLLSSAIFAPASDSPKRLPDRQPMCLEQPVPMRRAWHAQGSANASSSPCRSPGLPRHQCLCRLPVASIRPEAPPMPSGRYNSKIPRRDRRGCLLLPQ
jgi:hypothetical protein